MKGLGHVNVTPTQVEAKGKGLLDTYILTEKIDQRDMESNSEVDYSEDEDIAPKMIHAKTTRVKAPQDEEGDEKRRNKYKILENVDAKYKMSPLQLTGWQ